MMSKKFLVPVLALIGFGLPASASIVEYCTGSGCGADNNAAFTSALTSDGYSLSAFISFSTGIGGTGLLAGTTYTDDASGIVFADVEGNSLSLAGTALSTPAVITGLNYIQITIPSTITALQLSVTAQGGICLDVDCPANSSSVSLGFVGFINANPTGTWTVDVGAFNEGHVLEINSLNFASSAGSPTPEVATFVLIGFGLIAMRWMRRLPRRFFRTVQPAH